MGKAALSDALQAVSCSFPAVRYLELQMRNSRIKGSLISEHCQSRRLPHPLQIAAFSQALLQAPFHEGGLASAYSAFFRDSRQFQKEVCQQPLTWTGC